MIQMSTALCLQVPVVIRAGLKATCFYDNNLNHFRLRSQIKTIHKHTINVHIMILFCLTKDYIHSQDELGSAAWLNNLVHAEFANRSCAAHRVSIFTSEGTRNNFPSVCTSGIRLATSVEYPSTLKSL